MNYVIVMEQILNGQKWAIHQRVAEEIAIELVDKPIHFTNYMPDPRSPGVEVVWGEHFRHAVEDIDREMLRGSGAVLPDRTWRCEEDPWPNESYGSEACRKWSY